MSCNLIQIAQAVRAALAPGRQPNLSQVRHLLHFDSNTAYADTTGRPTSAEGVSSIDTSKKVFGSASLFSNSGGRVALESSAQSPFGLGDFTVEFWVYPLALDYLDNRPEYSYSIPFHQSVSTTSSNGSFQIRYNKAGRILVGLNYGASQLETADDVLRVGMWSHIAVTRENGVLKIWVNGKERASVTKQWDITEYGYIRIGWGIYGGNGVGMRAYIDEFRIVKGLAVYSQEFTPPTEPFTLPAA